MKKLLFILSLFISVSAFSQTGNDTTKYARYKNYGDRKPRYWADSVLDIPKDTTFSKYGLAKKGQNLFLGNGTVWVNVTGTGSLGVNSFNLRTGAVVSQASDYSAFYFGINSVHGTAGRLTYLGSDGSVFTTPFKNDSTNTRLDLNANNLFSNDGTNRYTLSPSLLNMTSPGTSANNLANISPLTGFLTSQINGLLTSVAGDSSSFGVGVGADANRATVYIAGSGTGAGQAQLKFKDKTKIATPEKGTLEFNNGLLFFTDSIATVIVRDTVAGRAWARANISGGGGGGGVVTSLTTTGTSGAATLALGVLNIPVYSPTPPNTGAGYRVYAPQIPAFKTLVPVAGGGLLIDSTTSTLNFRADSSFLATRSWVLGLTTTFNLRTPGTCAGCIVLAYVNTGALVIPKLGISAGGSFSMAGDSVQTINLLPFSTTVQGLVNAPGTATGKFLRDDNTWQTPAGGGSGTPGGIVGDMQVNNTVFAGANATWDFTNKIMNITFSQNNGEGFTVQNANAGASAEAQFTAYNGTYTTNVTQHGSGNAYSIIPVSQGALYSNGLSLSMYDDNVNGRLWLGAGANITAPEFIITPTKIKINPAVLQTGSSVDSILVYNTADSSFYAIAQSSISGTGVTLDATQTHTTGATITVTNGKNYLYVNPSSTLAALTITLPTTWHNSNELYIIFGGTITSGNPVITSLSIVGGSGQTLVQAVNPNGLTYYSGEVLEYKLNGTLDYRIQ